MEKIKMFVVQHFEKISVALVLLATITINYFTVYKIAFLQFFYLPILVAGYMLGRRMAVLFAILSILIVILFGVFGPQHYFYSAPIESTQMNIIFNLSIWAGFLLLTASVVGKLYEEKEKRLQDLHNAYMGVLEILTKYLESADKYTQGHSIRVSLLSTEVAIAMQLPRTQIENIKAAALLHDIGKIDISVDLIRKASALTEEEVKVLKTHTQKGVQIVASVGMVLKEAIPLILAHHEYFMHKEGEQKPKQAMASVPLGARIIAVADTYDAMITDRPYRRGKLPWEAVEEIGKHSGTQFDPQVVEAFKRVIAAQLEKD